MATSCQILLKRQLRRDSGGYGKGRSAVLLIWPSTSPLHIPRNLLPWITQLLTTLKAVKDAKQNSCMCEYTHFLIWLQARCSWFCWGLTLAPLKLQMISSSAVFLFTHTSTHRLIGKVLRSYTSVKNKSQCRNRFMRRGRKFFIPTFGSTVCFIVCFCWLLLFFPTQPSQYAVLSRILFRATLNANTM